MPGRLARLVTAATVTAVGLVVAATTAGAVTPGSPSPSGPDKVANALSYNINGLWTDDGRSKPKFTVANNTVVIDMSFAHRPNAVGSVISTTSILVTFPDTDTYIGTLEGPNLLRWSNGSTWLRVFTGSTVINVNGPWTDGARVIPISQVNGLITVNMFDSHRPNAFGLALNASTIQVTFPDSGTYIGTLQSPSTINWSNASSWHVFVDQSPGNPVCLQQHIVLC